jgi:hypothetical protein
VRHAAEPALPPGRFPGVGVSCSQSATALSRTPTAGRRSPPTGSTPGPSRGAACRHGGSRPRRTTRG